MCYKEAGPYCWFFKGSTELVASPFIGARRILDGEVEDGLITLALTPLFVPVGLALMPICGIGSYFEYRAVTKLADERKRLAAKKSAQQEEIDAQHAKRLEQAEMQCKTN